MATRVRLNHTEISSLLRRPGGPVHHEVTKHTRRVFNLAKATSPVDYGPLRASHKMEVKLNKSGKKVVGRIWATAPYALIVHEGRGPIRAKRAKALRFRPKGSRSYIFRTRVGPASPQPWLVNALEIGCPWPVRKRGE